MVKDPIRPNDAVIGDDAVERATGRRRDGWFTLLDERGAAAWDHPRIVAFLVDQEVEAWWAQSVTVGYEQARGLRHPGQRADGAFEAATSRTLTVPTDLAFAWLADVALRARWLDVEPEVRGTTPGRSVRWAWPDGGRVTARLTGLPDGRTRVAVQHRLVRQPVAEQRVADPRGPDDAERLTGIKQYWSDRLDALQELAAQG